MLAKQQRLAELCREILREDYLTLEAVACEVRESFREGKVTTRCELLDTLHDSSIHVEGTGVGLIDAFFQGFKAHFARTHLSLNTIFMVGVQVRPRTNTHRHTDGADAEAEVRIEIRNSYGKQFAFSDTSRSLLQSCFNATLLAVEYFVNSERAILRLRDAIQHAETAGRTDTVTTLTSQMADLVENTSYSEVIERIRTHFQ